MKIALFISFILPLFLRAQEFSSANSGIQTPDINPNDLIIERIECVGNDSTSCDLIQKEIYLEAGNKVNEEELSNAKIRLQLKNLFKSVNISLKKGSARGHVNIVVEVEEASAFFTETTLLSSPYTINRNSLFLTVGHRNLFGLGKILKFTGNTENRYDAKKNSGKLDYTDPNLFGSKRLYLNLSYSKDYISELECDECARNSEDATYQGTLGYRIFDFSYISISSEKRRYESEYIYESGKYVSETQTDTVSFGWNSEDDTYFPTQGEKFDVNIFKETHHDSYVPYDNYGFKTNYRYNSLLSSSHLLTFKLNIYQRGLENSNVNTWAAVPVEYAYIFSSSPKSDILRSRAFFELAPNFFDTGKPFQSSPIWAISTGYKLEHKKLGVINFVLGYWGL